MNLHCGHEVIEVDASIAEMSRPRVHIGAFEAPPGPASFSLERVPGLQGQRLETPLGNAVVELQANRLRVDIEDGQFTGELALRLTYFIVTSRAGGLLIHASGLAGPNGCLIASGKSGDGKSTLSRLCAGTTKLLGDEVVQLFPQGLAGGTPFRSDFDNVGSPGLHRVRLFVGLRKAEHEALEPLDAAAAYNLAFEQSFEPHAFALSRVETRKRLMAFLSNVPLGTLAFRKNEAVGPFVAALLHTAP